MPVIVVLVNDGSLALIKLIQERRYAGRFLGVDLINPDFGVMGPSVRRTVLARGFRPRIRVCAGGGSGRAAPAVIEVKVGGQAG